MTEAAEYRLYPVFREKLHDVTVDPELFMKTLEELHDSMKTTFMNPTIWGEKLDLHRLFLEVTSRGGSEKVTRDKVWTEITAAFQSGSTARSASYLLEHYYGSLLYHYEQIFYFEAPGWKPSDVKKIPLPGPVHVPNVQIPLPGPVPDPNVPQTATSSSSVGTPVSGMIDGKVESGFSVTVTVGSVELKGFIFQAPQNLALPTMTQHSSVPVNNSNTSSTASASPIGTAVSGMINGKSESGYLVTLTVGSEELKGFLYRATQNLALPTMPQDTSVPVNNSNTSCTILGVHRHRRKKCEIKRRDPGHPKPNQSGYSFFFADEHARLKPLHHGDNREIGKIVEELWNKLIEPEKAVYQEKALKDKERYRAEMENYREKLKTGQGIGDAAPLQEQIPNTDMMDADLKVDETEGAESPQAVVIGQP